MSWQLLITLHTFVIAISIISIRAVARQKIAANASLAVGAAQSIFFYIGALCLLPFFGSVDFSKLSEYFWWFLIGGVAAALGNASIYKLLAYLDAGISGILGTFNAIFAVIFAGMILHEKLSTLQLVGFMFLLVAIAYATLIARGGRIQKRNHQAWLKGLIFALLAGIILGLMLVNEKFLLGHMNISTYAVFGWGGQTVASIVLALMIQRDKLHILFDRTIFQLNIFNGLTRTIAGLLFVLSVVKSNNVALTSAIANFRLILVVLLGAIFLKERQKIPQKLAAACIALVGLSFLLWN